MQAHSRALVPLPHTWSAGQCSLGGLEVGTQFLDCSATEGSLGKDPLDPSPGSQRRQPLSSGAWDAFISCLHSHSSLSWPISAPKKAESGKWGGEGNTHTSPQNSEAQGYPLFQLPVTLELKSSPCSTVPRLQESPESVLSPQ